jgi:hypothetical protein
MVEVAMKHGEPHTFMIVDNRILRQREDKSDTVLRLPAIRALYPLRTCPTPFCEYPLQTPCFRNRETCAHFSNDDASPPHCKVHSAAAIHAATGFSFYGLPWNLEDLDAAIHHE